MFVMQVVSVTGSYFKDDVYSHGLKIPLIRMKNPGL